jgi:hypothetical protein
MLRMRFAPQTTLPPAAAEVRGQGGLTVQGGRGYTLCEKNPCKSVSYSDESETRVHLRKSAS